LEQFPKTLPHPAFVMVTGDMLAHDFPATFQSNTHDNDPQRYRAFVLKTVEFLGLELQHKFPGTKIFITPGNNDNDCGDYSVEAGGTFLHDTAAMARELAGAGDDAATSWSGLGSFNVGLPKVAGARLVSLNSVFWSAKYQALSSRQGCAAVPSTAPADLMRWLEQQLAAAAEAHEKVWLMFHVPPGIDGYASGTSQQTLSAEGAAAGLETCAKSIVPMWAPQWTAQFDALLAKYSSTVAAMMAAHTHSDDFRLFGGAEGERPFLMMAPAISPVYEQNPGFRVVSYRSDGKLDDQTTYYLTNVPQASSSQKGRWKREYSYTRQWRADGLNASSLGRVYDQIVSNEKARAEWLKLYGVSGPALEGEKPIARALYCAVEGLSVEAYQQCYCGAKP
ncbi:MAG TPA: hypothetical protein VE779_11090, partial [Candidatus Angelobacter sp.]|nr:hypothetical protein [Candidatus Angelobacter sp.]